MRKPHSYTRLMIRFCGQGMRRSSMEVVRAAIPFDAVVLSVGGGGLLAGVAEGLARNGLHGYSDHCSRNRRRSILAQLP